MGRRLLKAQHLTDRILGYPIDEQVVKRLKMGDWSFGHAGRHHGNGSPGCPRELHHHCDEFCQRPTNAELRAAGIRPKDFKARSRA